MDTTATTLTATDNTISVTFSALTTAVAVTSGQAFAFLDNRVYRVCIYVGVSKDTAFSSATEKACGTYHTYSPDSDYSSITNLDRNLGNYIYSK